MEALAISPDLIRWARSRSNLSVASLIAEFPRYAQWESGTARLDVNELELFSKRTQTPFGYFFLDAPPDDSLPIRDFRTVRDKNPRHPSPNLLETIQTMQRRQSWLREELIEQGAEKLPFVGSAQRLTDHKLIAALIRKQLGIETAWARAFGSWEQALSGFREYIDRVGIIVVKNGCVGNNTRRTLDPEEFRGFVLCDDYAPIIFVNGADAKSAQMFTMAHELAHVWLGQDAVFDLAELRPASDKIEKLCNSVAAELLVPENELLDFVAAEGGGETKIFAISSHFRVSPIVAARRSLDLKLISRDDFFAYWASQSLAMDPELDADPKGGNFYNNLDTRIGKRLVIAVLRAAKEGRLLYRDAYQLTGLRGRVFETYAKRFDSEVF